MWKKNCEYLKRDLLICEKRRMLTILWILWREEQFMRFYEIEKRPVNM